MAQNADTQVPEQDGPAAPSPPSMTSATAYCYSTLPGPRHIRLVKLDMKDDMYSKDRPNPLWDSKEDITCTLETFHLEDAPPYEALSYTWGTPMTVFQNADKCAEYEQVFSQPRSVLCDGKAISVTVNLFDSLLVLRRIPSDSYEQLADAPRAEYIWIDSICIDQENITERNAQVTIMSEIYRQAQSVFIWLGRDDIFTRPAANVLMNLSKLPDSSVAAMKRESYIFGESKGKSFGLPSFDTGTWLSVYAFLHRSWFKRVWILQEVALARRTAVLCGLVGMQWPMLVQASEKLFYSGWYADLASTAKDYMDGRSPSALGQFRGIDETAKYLHQVDYDPMFHTPKTIVGVTDTRGGLGIEDNVLKLTESRKAFNFTELMEFFRYSLSSEPRDKVYSLYGLLPKDGPDRPHGIETPMADYRKSIATVYTEAAWLQLRWAKNLDLLGHVQDAAHTKTLGLPSWVPDYKVMLLPNPLSETIGYVPYGSKKIDKVFDACGDLQFTCPPPSEELQLILPIEAILVDTIAQTSAFEKGHSLSEVLSLLPEMPHLYWADVVAQAKKRKQGGVGDDSDGLTIRIKNGYSLDPPTASEGKPIPTHP